MIGSLPAAGQTTEAQSVLGLERLKIIDSILSKSLQDVSDSRCRFIPRDAIMQGVSREVVSAFLQHCPGSCRGQNTAPTETADRISPPPGGCYCGQARCTGGRITFVALLAIRKENLFTSVFKLAEPAICDSQLSLLSRKGADSSRTLPEAFSGLTTEELERFIHFTWQMRSPFVEGFAPERSKTAELGAILEFETNASLPWTYLGGGKDPMEEEEEVSRVQRITVHPAHHDPVSSSTFTC